MTQLPEFLHMHVSESMESQRRIIAEFRLWLDWYQYRSTMITCCKLEGSPGWLLTRNMKVSGDHTGNTFLLREVNIALFSELLFWEFLYQKMSWLYQYRQSERLTLPCKPNPGKSDKKSVWTLLIWRQVCLFRADGGDFRSPLTERHYQASWDWDKKC